MVKLLFIKKITVAKEKLIILNFDESKKDQKIYWVKAIKKTEDFLKYSALILVFTLNILNTQKTKVTNSNALKVSWKRFS